MNKRYGRVILGALACAAAVTASANVARAQGSDEARARALFSEARELADAGHYDVACPRFEAASRLFPSAGLLVNLADCYEKVGRTASASEAFAQAEVVAARTSRTTEAAEAKARQGALVARLTRLSIRVAHAAPGLTIKRDGVDVPAASWGSPVAVDPGIHAITAGADGYAPWTQTIAVTGEGKTVALDVPELRPVPPPAPPAPAPASPPPSVALPALTTPAEPFASQRASPPPAAAATPECRDDHEAAHGWGYLDGTIAVAYSTVASLNTSDFAAENTSGGGGAFGIGAGLRLSFFTVGVRARDVLLSNLSVWEIDAESALHVQSGSTEVYFGLRGGYVSGSVSEDPNNSNESNVDGFNLGTMLGFDNYLTHALSWGLELNPELVDLQRPPLPLPAGLNASMLTPQQQGLYEASGLNVGLIVLGSLHLGLHF